MRPDLRNVGMSKRRWEERKGGKDNQFLDHCVQLVCTAPSPTTTPPVSIPSFFSRRSLCPTCMPGTVLDNRLTLTWFHSITLFAPPGPPFPPSLSYVRPQTCTSTRPTHVPTRMPMHTPTDPCTHPCTHPPAHTLLPIRAVMPPPTRSRLPNRTASAEGRAARYGHAPHGHAPPGHGHAPPRPHAARPRAPRAARPRAPPPLRRKPTLYQHFTDSPPTHYPPMADPWPTHYQFITNP